MEHSCKACNNSLGGDEIALYRKLISRGATEYLCLGCLADGMGVKREKLENMIAFYHRTGICSLFAHIPEA